MLTGVLFVCDHCHMAQHSEYRHPKHDEMSRRVREGATNLDIARELHVDRRAVARVRVILGVKPMTNSTSAWDKLDKFSSEPDQAGHIMWTGRRGNAGTPEIRHRGTSIPAAHVAFERRTGRKPVGTCRADCDVQQCVAPAHVVDDIERRTIRGQERAVYGLDPVPWDKCPEGHSWGVHGRFEPDLTPYCRRCNTLRARRSRDARNDERN